MSKKTNLICKKNVNDFSLGSFEKKLSACDYSFKLKKVPNCNYQELLLHIPYLRSRQYHEIVVTNTSTARTVKLLLNLILSALFLSLYG